VNFPLSDWIDDHADCRHDLARSGMAGTVRHPLPTAREVRSADENELRQELAASLGVAPERLFLTHGAHEANAWIASFLARSSRKRGRSVRVCFPEYPPLVDVFRRTGFTVARGGTRAEVAAVSQPRNPEGDRWDDPRLAGWADGARAVVVDETFREFAAVPSVSAEGRPGWWATGTFTKFYGGDDLRVGFAVAPPEAVREFAKYHGVAADRLAPYSVAGALRTLREGPRIRREVHRVMDRNRALWCRATGAVAPAGPTAFDRTTEPGDALGARCLAASVLVCPGSFFGVARGVRVCLTRRSFAVDLAAYLAVRDRA
jgi:histidinol-phosphate/aromatic aminotransferase/cobyric acid decarboxylase-like protein